MFGIFKRKTKEQPPVKPADENGLKEYAQILANETITIMQENFRQAQEQRQADYADTVKRHNSLIAAIDVKSYDGPTQPKDLTPYEVLFLWYIDGCTAKEPGIAIYWTYEYNFGDFSEAIDKLLQAGYLRVSDYKFNMQKCTTTELKEVLKQHDLKVSGKKTDLIERLEANVNADVLKDTFSRGYLQLTEAGKLLTESYSHVILWHQYKNLMINDMNPASVHNFYLSHKHLNAHDVLIEYNKQYAEKWTADPDHRPASVCYYAIGRMYELKEDHLSALYWYLLRCYIDLSGVGEKLRECDDNLIGFQPGESFYRSDDEIREKVSVAPAILADTKACITTVELSDNELKDLYATAASSVKLARTVYSVEEAYPVLLEALENLQI